MSYAAKMLEAKIVAAKMSTAKIFMRRVPGTDTSNCKKGATRWLPNSVNIVKVTFKRENFMGYKLNLNRTIVLKGVSLWLRAQSGFLHFWIHDLCSDTSYVLFAHPIFNISESSFLRQ